MGEAAFSCKSVFIAVLGHRLVPVALASYQDTAVSPRTAGMLRGSADTADGRNPSRPPGMRWREQEVQHAELPRRGGWLPDPPALPEPFPGEAEPLEA